MLFRSEALYVRQLRLPEPAQWQDREWHVWDVGLGAAANVLALMRALRDRAVRVRVVSFDHTLEPLVRHDSLCGYRATIVPHAARATPRHWWSWGRPDEPAHHVWDFEAA